MLPLTRWVPVVLLPLFLPLRIEATQIIDVDGFADSAVLTAQYPGLTFTYVAVGITPNEFFAGPLGIEVESERSRGGA